MQRRRLGTRRDIAQKLQDGGDQLGPGSLRAMLAVLAALATFAVALVLNVAQGSARRTLRAVNAPR